jgi:hypothetical protein
MRRNKESLWEHWNIIKRENIWVICVQDGFKNAKGLESQFKEAVTENFPNLEKETNMQVEEGQQLDARFNSSKSIPRNIIVKLSKVTDK